MPPETQSLPPYEPSFGRERDLRASLSAEARPCVLSGGQTGVDTAAAIAALSAGLAVHLVFPRGYRQEDGPVTQARRRAFRGATLHELASPDFRYRTWTCVHLADAVILIDPAGGDGCQETMRAAAHFGRPLLSLAAGAEFFQPERIASGLAHVSELAPWLAGYRPRVLMIAGCRASLLASYEPEHGPASRKAAVPPGGERGEAQLGLDAQLDAIMAEYTWQSAKG